MINDYSNGGLGMLDVQSFNYALKRNGFKSTWIQIMNGNGNCFWTFSLENMTLNYSSLET